MEQIARLWLRTQCQMMAGTCHAVLVLAAPAAQGGAAAGGQRQPSARLAAVWPDNQTPPPPLAEVSMRVIAQRQSVFKAKAMNAAALDGNLVDILGAPVVMNGELVGAVAIAMTSGDVARQRLAYHSLRLGCAWFESLVKAEATAVAGRLSAVIETVAAILEHNRFEAAASALVNALCERGGYARASLGWRSGAHMKPYALSHSASFEPGGTLARDLSAVMEETTAKRGVVRSTTPEEPVAIEPYPAHAKLVAQRESGAVCSIPITHDDQLLGVVVLERDSASAFTDDEVDVCEAALALAGPILELKRSQSQSVTQALGVQELFEGHPHSNARKRWLGRAALIAAVSAALALSFVIKTDFRIAAPARVEGSVQRVVSATQDGFVALAPVRAGDQVREGDLLAQLDDKDLQVQARKWQARLRQSEKEYRDALAQHDRAQVSIVRAEMDEARAEADLAQAQLSRTRMLAPFDGVVVSGDLSQSLGAPVERGQVLFELAPLSGYRVVVHVDERDVAHLRAGQKGSLALTALPHSPMDLALTRVTSVAHTDSGNHYFRVEALIDSPQALIRPGMEGVAKVNIEARSLAFIWSRRLREWLRLAIWRWMP